MKEKIIIWISCRAASMDLLQMHLVPTPSLATDLLHNEYECERFNLPLRPLFLSLSSKVVWEMLAC